MHVWQIKLLLVCTCCRWPSLHIVATLIHLLRRLRTGSKVVSQSTRKGKENGHRHDESNRNIKSYSLTLSQSATRRTNIRNSPNMKILVRNTGLSLGHHIHRSYTAVFLEALLPQQVPYGMCGTAGSSVKQSCKCGGLWEGTILKVRAEIDSRCSGAIFLETLTITTSHHQTVLGDCHGEIFERQRAGDWPHLRPVSENEVFRQ